MVRVYLEKIPPLISVPAYFVVVFIILILEFLFTTTFGALLLALSVYVYFDSFTLVSPYTSAELLIWLDGLSIQYRVALFTSIVTITGFVIAFHTATLSWKNQMRAQLKIQAAREFESFFSVVSSNITTAEIYIESLVNTANNIKNGAADAESSFEIGYNQGKVHEFISSRDALSRYSIEITRLISRNHNILLTGWGMLADANRADESLEKITNVMWLHIPVVDLNDPNHIKSFVDQVDITKCTKFLKVCEANYGIISGLSGGIQGNLSSSIWGISSGLFIDLVQNWKNFSKFVYEIHDKLNDKPTK